MKEVAAPPTQRQNNKDIDVRQTNQSEFEKEFTILGVTAMEDLLQDQVSECITDFKEAGMRVWMLTGDKGDTAH